jgi:hypothetical protein
MRGARSMMTPHSARSAPRAALLMALLAGTAACGAALRVGAGPVRIGGGDAAPGRQGARRHTLRAEEDRVQSLPGAPGPLKFGMFAG